MREFIHKIVWAIVVVGMVLYLIGCDRDEMIRVLNWWSSYEE